MAGPQNFVSVSRRPPDVEDYIDIMRRYRSWIIGPTFAGLVVSVVCAFLWPDMYSCTAAMQIKPGAVDTSLVPSALNSRLAERLRQMRLQILGRDNLITMIKKPALDLYKKERERSPVEDLAEEMGRKHVQIFPIENGEGRGAQAFRIQFEYPDRVKARQVVMELVSQFTAQNITLQSNTATTATNFLESEVKKAKDRWDEAQNQLAAFSAENQGRLPDNFQANMIEVQNKTAIIANVNDQISQERARGALIDSNLANNKNLQSQAEANLHKTRVIENSAVRNQNLINLENMIATKGVECANLLRTFQEGYPAVLACKDAKRGLEEQRDNIEKQQGMGTAATATSQLVDDPQVALQLSTLQADERNLKGQMANSQLMIEAKLRQLVELNKQLKEAQDKIAASPAVIQRYNALTQALNMAKDDFEHQSKARDVTATQQNMDSAGAGETLETLEQAITPETPTSPQRGVIVAMGTMAGLALGVALAGAREIKNTSLKNLKDVRAYTNLPVLSSIPLLENGLLVRRKRRLAWLAWSSAIIIGSLLMCASVYYHQVIAKQILS